MEDIVEEKDENKAEGLKVSVETATAQIKSFMKSYDIDQNDLVIDQGPESIETIVNRLIRAITTGQLEILDDGRVRLNLVKPFNDVKDLTFERLTGTAQRAYADIKNTFSAHMAQMGSLGNIPPSKLSTLDPVDLSIIQRLSTLFTVV